MMKRGLVLAIALALSSGSALAQVRVHDHSDRDDDDDDRGEGRGRFSVTGFSPQSGPAGTVVTITGSGFRKVKLLFGGQKVRPDAHEDEYIRFTVPAGAYDGTIVLSRGERREVAVGTFVITVDPVITGFSPQSGGPGTRVEIVGTGFQPGDQVYLSGRLLAAMEPSPSRLVVIIPPGVGSDYFTLVRPGGARTISRARFNVAAMAPMIMSVTPNAGLPGTAVRIAGHDFSPDDAVFFGRMQCEIRGRSPTAFDISIPRNAQRDEYLFVRGPGHPDAQSPTPFDIVMNPVISSYAPTFGPAGTRVEILGSSFMSGDAVYLGGRALQVLSLEASRIVVVIPPGVQSDYLTVMRAGQPVARTGGVFDVTIAATISGFYPTSGGPGTQVTINGTSFGPDLRVFYGTQPLAIQGRSGTSSVTVTVPHNATTSQPFLLTTRGMEIRTGQQFTLYVAPLVDSVYPTSGPPGTQVTIRGQNFSGSEGFYLAGVSLPVVDRGQGGYVVRIPPSAGSGVIEIEAYGQRQATRYRFDVLRLPVISSFSPTSGAPGSEIRIHGDNFSNAVQVYFGGTAVQITRRTPREISFLAPAAYGQDYLWVEDYGQRVRSNDMLRIVAPPPVASGVSPQAGPVGTQVVISGQNFSPNVRVWLGSAECPISQRSPNQLVVTIPGGAYGRNPFTIADDQIRIATPQWFEVLTPPPPPPPPVNDGHHEHAHAHPHGDGGHHHHPHAHPHPTASDHHHPY